MLRLQIIDNKKALISTIALENFLSVRTEEEFAQK